MDSLAWLTHAMSIKFPSEEWVAEYERAINANPATCVKPMFSFRYNTAKRDRAATCPTNEL